MKRMPNNFNSVQDWKWFCIKLLTGIFWFRSLYKMTVCCPDSPLPVGICRLYSFDILFTPAGSVALLSALAVVTCLYLAEKWMLFTTFAYFAFCLIIISHHESNGLYERNTLLSTIIGAQFIAYLAHTFNKDFDLKFYRVQFSIQVIAAGYMLSALNKLHVSGWAWVNTGPYFALQVLKNYSFNYFNTGDYSNITEGTRIANWLLSHRQWLSVLFTATLFLEGCSLLAAFSERIRPVYGICLLAMHIGIYITTGIIIGGVLYPMFFYFLNPLYYLSTYTAGAFARFKGKAELN